MAIQLFSSFGHGTGGGGVDSFYKVLQQVRSVSFRVLDRSTASLLTNACACTD